MARVTKNPQERTNELIDAAEELFLTNGYDKTSVSDIVKKIGVAQGTFYYYFQTKEEILDAIAVRYFTMIRGECEKIDRGQPAPQQLRLMFYALFRVSMRPGKQGNGRLFRYLFPEKHFHLLERIEQKGYEMLRPFFLQLIEQGAAEGSMQVVRIEATVDLITCIVERLFQLHGQGDQAKFLEYAQAVEYMIERSLAMKEGVLQLTEYFTACKD